jgi:hypothetical protein
VAVTVAIALDVFASPVAVAFIALTEQVPIVDWANASPEIDAAKTFAVTVPMDALAVASEMPDVLIGNSESA